MSQCTSRHVKLCQRNQKEATSSICVRPTLRQSFFGETKVVKRPRIDDVVRIFHSFAEPNSENVDETLQNGIMDTGRKPNIEKEKKSFILLQKIFLNFLGTTDVFTCNATLKNLYFTGKHFENVLNKVGSTDDLKHDCDAISENTSLFEDFHEEKLIA